MTADHLTLTRPALSVALGGGGMFGIGYHLGVLHGLCDGGVDALHDAPVIGTSAGAWAAAALALDLSFADFERIDPPQVPDTTPGILHAAAVELFGDARSDRVRATAVQPQRRRRVVLSGSEHPLADLAAASAAVPGLLPSHRVGRRVLVDGGLRSVVAADLAAPADHLLVIAPIAGHLFGPLSSPLELMTAAEIGGWRAANRGASVTTIQPDRRVGAMAGIRPQALFDADLAKYEVYPAAYRQGLRWAPRLAERLEQPHRAAATGTAGDLAA